MVRARRVDRVVDHGARARGIDDERLVGEAIDRDRLERGERVVGRQRGDERLDAEALDDQVGVVDGRAQQRDVQRSVEQALDLRRREHLAPQVETDARQLRAQRLGHVRQQRVGHRAGEAHRQAPELAGGRRTGVLPGRAGGREDHARPLEQHLARRQQAPRGASCDAAGALRRRPPGGG